MKVPEPRKLSSGKWFIQLRLGGRERLYFGFQQKRMSPPGPADQGGVSGRQAAETDESSPRIPCFDRGYRPVYRPAEQHPVPSHHPGLSDHPKDPLPAGNEPADMRYPAGGMATDRQSRSRLLQSQNAEKRLGAYPKRDRTFLKCSSAKNKIACRHAAEQAFPDPRANPGICACYLSNAFCCACAAGPVLPACVGDPGAGLEQYPAKSRIYPGIRRSGAG